jgi:hypothetical protein
MTSQNTSSLATTSEGMVTMDDIKIICSPEAGMLSVLSELITSTEVPSQTSTNPLPAVVASSRPVAPGPNYSCQSSLSPVASTTPDTPCRPCPIHSPPCSCPSHSLHCPCPSQSPHPTMFRTPANPHQDIHQSHLCTAVPAGQDEDQHRRKQGEVQAN